MLSKNRLHSVAVWALALFVLLSGAFLVTRHYTLSFLSLGGILVSVRARLHLGYRGFRGTIFATHLACSFSYLTALLLLVFKAPFFWALPLAQVAFIGMLATGTVLVRRSWQPVY